MLQFSGICYFKPFPAVTLRLGLGLGSVLIAGLLHSEHTQSLFHNGYNPLSRFSAAMIYNDRISNAPVSGL